MAWPRGRARSRISGRALPEGILLSRLFLLGFVALSLAGCLDTRKEKIYVRRVPPTKEELDALPPPAYEDVLRRQDAQREKLAVPGLDPWNATGTDTHSLHDDTRYLDEGRRSMSVYLQVNKDPWGAYESDRIKTLQARDWADCGKSPPPEVFPKHEPPVEEDPFAPVAKMGKKKEGEGEAPAEGDKGGEKKDDAKGEEKK